MRVDQEFDSRWQHIRMLNLRLTDLLIVRQWFSYYR